MLSFLFKKKTPSPAAILGGLVELAMLRTPENLIICKHDTANHGWAVWEDKDKGYYFKVELWIACETPKCSLLSLGSLISEFKFNGKYIKLPRDELLSLGRAVESILANRTAKSRIDQLHKNEMLACDAIEAYMANRKIL